MKSLHFFENHPRVFQTVIAHLHTVCSDSFLSRRFFDQGFRSTNSCFPNGNGNSAFSKSGFFDILEEVRVDSFSEFSVPRGTLQTCQVSFFHQRKNLYPSVREFCCSNSVRNSQTVFSTVRFPQLTRGSGSARASPLRPLQFYLLQHWLPASQEWEAKIPLLPSLLPHLQWWINIVLIIKP